MAESEVVLNHEADTVGRILQLAEILAVTAQILHGEGAVRRYVAEHIGEDVLSLLVLVGGQSGCRRSRC